MGNSTGTQHRFDPLLGARALETMAGFALLSREPTQLIDSASPIMVAAADVLRTAKAWLAANRASAAAFSGDKVLCAIGAHAPLPLDNFAAALKESAVELLQVVKPAASI